MQFLGALSNNNFICLNNFKGPLIFMEKGRFQQTNITLDCCIYCKSLDTFLSGKLSLSWQTVPFALPGCFMKTINFWETVQTLIRLLLRSSLIRFYTVF